MWDLGPDKSSEPDDFPLFFLIHFWKETKEDIFDLLRELTRGIARFNNIDYSQVVLILNIDSLTMVGEHKSIALLNSSSKIISMILANRLVPILIDMVDKY